MQITSQIAAPLATSKTTTMKRILIVILSSAFLFSCNNEKTAKEQAHIDMKDCNCLEDYRWIKETFEKNDAGFEWIIQKKGIETYQKFCDSIEVELKNTKDIYTCNEILNDWGKFFRKGHFYISLNVSSSKDTASGIAEKVNYSIKTVETQAKQINDKIIGIWESYPYKMGIVLDTLNQKRKYVGFIIESDVLEWTKGDVKLEIYEQNNKLISNYYMQDRSIEKRSVTLKDETELMIGLMRFVNSSKIENEIERKLSNIFKPLFYELSENTTILKIPSFNADQKEKIDNKIEQSRESILSHKNLIIDLRNNGGGSDNSWKEIVPFIYTNPIKTIGVEFLSTELNRKQISNPLSFIQRLFNSNTPLKYRLNS